MILSELINKYYDNLNKTDMLIYQYINTHKKECCKLTIDELAYRCNVSRTTILRFSQKLSLSGYGELKVYLRLENEKNAIDNVDILDTVCESYHKTIDDFKNRDCTNICRMIHEAKRVFVYGTGNMQSTVARDMQRKFLNSQKCIYQFEGIKETDILLNMVEYGDLVIIISLSGESEHVISFARNLKLKDIPIIAFTKLNGNTLARMSDENLYVGTSTVNSVVNENYETSMLFYMITEILLIKYMIFKNKLENGV